ncbi:MAG: HAMP domain-containing sensor histidine kinase [Candidatus Cryptobacteroides sp.]|nr:HAMP domain-containing sensor histidine kinase [Bacteroidales bacterium]MDY6158097.1 HAMP domain-containing sensor histidine kinase [Candidatus Cryptobacteroides sp.]
MALIVAAAVLVTTLLCYLVQTRQIKRKINYMLDALEDGESNFRFGRGKMLDRGINRTLNRLKALFDKETREIREAEAWYAQMLDQVQTGILVFEEKNGRVVYSNRKARELLGLSSLTSMRQLSVIDRTLGEAFLAASEEGESKASFYNESFKKNISISSSSAHIRGKDVKINAFNDISSAIEQTESESWHRLIRVLTHEIMNTVTPIASLSEALQQVEGDELNKGLRTIAASSRNLIKFVESYRNLTRVATPVKKAFYVRDLAASVLELTESQLRSAGATAAFEEKKDDILLYADESQISQILVNLIRNAVQAGAKHIRLSADLSADDSVVINVGNDGAAISPESQEQIFVPFFTTKSDGTGIGLSLSRQIMRMHGGNMRLLRSDSRETVFSLIFR